MRAAPFPPLQSPVELQLQQASVLVYMVGFLPPSSETSSGAALLRDWLGTYERLPQLINNRPAYAQLGFQEPLRMLWYSGEDWLVGPEFDVPLRRGWMNVRDAAILPDRIKTEWQIGNGRLSWLPAPKLRCSATPEAKSAAITLEKVYVAELARALPVVYLAGDPAFGMWREWLGAYEKKQDGKLVNGRHAYVQRGSEGARMLWYTDGVFWRAGPAEDVGRQRGPLRALDGTLLPENIAAVWEAGDGGDDEEWNVEETQGGWVASPHLRCFGVDGGINETEIVVRWEVGADGTTSAARHVS